MATKINLPEAELPTHWYNIVPDLPAPNSLITKELRKAAGKAVNGARNEAERRSKR